MNMHASWYGYINNQEVFLCLIHNDNIESSSIYNVITLYVYI